MPACRLPSASTISRQDRAASPDAARAAWRRPEGLARVLDIAKLVAGREKYYTREIADDRAEYYAGHGESGGRWFGAKAASMGLYGVAADGTEGGNNPFLHVYYGRDPRTGQLLGRPHRRDGVHAFDLVFRPTKSVSLLYAFGSPMVAARTKDAHHAGIEAAIAYLDRHVGARRGHNGLERIGADGLLAVGFDHRTSRTGDPPLHTHLIVANRVQAADGRWTALDGRDLYAHAMLRPGSWIRPAGASPVRVDTGVPGSRPQFVGETRRAERGVKSLFGGSKRAGRSMKRILQPRQSDDGGAEPLMSRRRPRLPGLVPGSAWWVPPGYGERHARKVWSGTGETRLPGRRRAKTAGIGRW
jgi:TrwC relaxase